MELKHVRNILDNGIAVILIYDEIGQYIDESTGKIIGVSGVEIAHEIALLNQMSDVKEIHVRINSSGGNVLEGYSIISAMINSTKVVKTFNDGVAASIAGIIFLAGQTREMVDFGRLMIHDPSTGQTAASMSAKQRTMLKNFRDALLKILTNNSNLDQGAIDKLMSAETWITPMQAINQGFADTIKSTERVFNAAIRSLR